MVVPTWADAGVAAVLGAIVVLGSVVATRAQAPAHPLDAGAFSLIAVAVAAPAWRHRAAVTVLGVVVVAVSAYLLVGYPYGPIQLCMVLAVFDVARLRGLRDSAAACAVAGGLMAAATLSRVLTGADIPVLLVVIWLSWLFVPWSAGALVQVRSEAARRSRRELAECAALRERVRMAREVHDVAGHGFAAVAMQAGVALLVFEEDPEQAKRSLEAIRSTSRNALADLRVMLDTSDRPGGADAGPLPGLRDLPALADHVCAAGLPVELSVEGVTVPGETGRVAYRVVQEALTNALRHAGPTTATVRVHQERDMLVVQVRDRGAGTGEVMPGLGLEGMRKRVAAVGGELVTWSRRGGGFRVTARFPTGGAAT